MGINVMTRTTPTKVDALSQAELAERLHLALLADVQKGLGDSAAGRVENADVVLARIQAGRAFENSPS